jgi:hypothetical protein
MSNFLIIFVAAIYCYIGLDFILKQQIGMGITFLAYALANFGLYLESKL